MIEIRVTRPMLYAGLGPQSQILSVRQGHYIQGDNLEDAVKKIFKTYPHEVLDVQVGDKGRWKFEGRYILRWVGTPDEQPMKLPPLPLYD